MLHPAIQLARNPPLPWPPRPDASAPLTLVSINRFERKKGLQLAVLALQELRRRSAAAAPTAAAPTAAPPRLVLAGGWDARLRENVEHFDELRALVSECGLDGAVELKRNVSEAERRDLFGRAAAVVYTPSFEHFGIVPLEAMAAGRPVIAVGLGGPCESVVHGQTGWLCEPTPAAFAAAFAEAARLEAAGELRGRGLAARARVEEHFSLGAFGEKLEAHLTALCR